MTALFFFLSAVGTGGDGHSILRQTFFCSCTLMMRALRDGFDDSAAQPQDEMGRFLWMLGFERVRPSELFSSEDEALLVGRDSLVLDLCLLAVLDVGRPDPRVIVSRLEASWTVPVLVASTCG
jgi:hypothetical protein